MRLSGKQLKGLPVETKSGMPLGKAAGMIFDTTDHRIIQYVVKKAHSLAKILPAKMLVHTNQVISIDAERMVVEDGIVSEKEKAQAMPVGQEHPAAAHSPVTRSVEGVE